MRASSKLKVLVPVDFAEPSRRALAHVAGWPPARGELHVAYVDCSHNGGSARAEPADLAHWLRELEGVAREATAPRSVRAAIATHIAAGHPPTEIVRLAARLGVDLIVMGAGNRPGQVRLGSVAEHVARTAPCPVLLVSPEPRKRRRRRRVLCVVDDSEGAKLAVPAAIGAARRLRGELLLVHVRKAEGAEEAGRQALASWKRVAEEAAVKVRTEVIAGPPAAAVVRYARENECDLIVMRSGEARPKEGRHGAEAHPHSTP